MNDAGEMGHDWHRASRQSGGGPAPEVAVPESAIREAMERTKDMEDPHRYHTLCAKLMSAISGYGPMHDHLVTEPCTPACPVYDPAAE